MQVSLPPAVPAVLPEAAAGVGDGGASWRMKALKRARAQAAERGESLASAVQDRHGSLAHLTEGLSARSAAPGWPHRLQSWTACCGARHIPQPSILLHRPCRVATAPWRT